jgi:hypothetical protein
MQGQPHGGGLGVGPLHPVAAVGRDEQIVPRGEYPGLGFILEAQPGAAAQERHPLVGVLVVPLPRRRGLARRHDALQAKISGRQENLDDFRADLGGNRVKQILQNIIFHLLYTSSR